MSVPSKPKVRTYAKALTESYVPNKVRYATGKALRATVPHAAHAEWTTSASRADPVDLVLASNEGRIHTLVPIRHGRMMISPFTFYRGTASVMAADLAQTPVTGLITQLCGDCHLMNFGAFATPERNVIFDINDFDETLPGPWEWDVKRLAASFVMAARSNGFTAEDQTASVLACLRSYREHMAEFAEMSALDTWYYRVDVKALLKDVRDKKMRKLGKSRLKKAGLRSIAEDDFPKLVELIDGKPTIKEVPPLIFRHPGIDHEGNFHQVSKAFERYRATLSDDRRALLDRYRLIDTSMKVVGVGSVGTFCAILLMMADHHDPLFLQVKEARPSVLEKYLPPTQYKNHGERVVRGQRLMQSASDIFLGWTRGARELDRHFYARQLRDLKIKPLVEVYNPSALQDYAEACGSCLARAHARAGDAAMIAGYLGKSDSFDQALARFSTAYADQTESDHARFVEAIRAGRVEAAPDS